MTENTPPARPVTVPTIRARKGKTPIVALTAYDFPTAQELDDLVDLILVGVPWAWSFTGSPIRRASPWR